MKLNLKHISGPLTRACLDCGQQERAERRGDIPRGKGEGMHEEFPVEQPGARLGTTATITATGARDGQWQCWGGEGISISLFAAHKMEHLFFALHISIHSSKCLTGITGGHLPCSANPSSCGLS